MSENLPTTINLNDPRVIDTIRKTVAQGADDVELSMFLEFCKSAGLNPFKREAWCIKAGGRLQIMTGLNGYLKIANKHQQFDGMEIDIVEEGGRPSKAIARVYRKDRRIPSTGIALMKEYGKETPIWKQMPSVMLGKVAKCIAIREAFPLETEGTYAEEEMPPQFAAEPIKAQVRVADELPPRPTKLFHYLIDTVPADKLPAAKMLLERAGAEAVNDFGMYASPRRIAKLDAYELKDDGDQIEEGNHNENHNSI